jgi:hypothetical protein
MNMNKHLRKAFHDMFLRTLRQTCLTSRVRRHHGVVCGHLHTGRPGYNGKEFYNG